MAIQPIDSDAYTADESGAGWLPFVIRSNIQNCGEERHAGNAWARTDPTQNGTASVTVSTPSTLWLGIPFQVRVGTSAETLHLDLRYTCAEASVDVRLMCMGSVGVTSTLTTTGTPTTVELSVVLPLMRAGEIVTAELQVRSTRKAGGAEDTITVTGMSSNATQWSATSIAGGLGSGVTHFEGQVTAAPPGELSGRTVYHIGRIETAGGGAGDLLTWPAWELTDPSTSDPATVDVYKVGQLTVMGWAWWAEGARSRGLPESIGEPDVQTSATLWSTAHTWLAEVYGRGLVWCSGPPSGMGASSSFGVVVDATDVCGAAIVERRNDSAGVVVSVLYLPINSAATPEMTVRIYGSDGTEEETSASDVIGEPRDGMRSLVASPSASDATSSTGAWMVRARGGGTSAGTRDLCAAGESVRTTPSAVGWSQAVVTAAWPAGVSVGEIGRVTVEFDADCHVRDVMIAEDI